MPSNICKKSGLASFSFSQNKIEKKLLFLRVLEVSPPLRGLGSQKIDFFCIAIFNSITIQKENSKVLSRLGEKWKNERQKGWAPFAKINGPQEIEAYFIFVPFCSDCKKTEVQIGLKICLLSQNMFLYGLNLRIKL